MVTCIHCISDTSLGISYQIFSVLLDQQNWLLRRTCLPLFRLMAGISLFLYSFLLGKDLKPEIQVFVYILRGRKTKQNKTKRTKKLVTCIHCVSDTSFGTLFQFKFLCLPVQMHSFSPLLLCTWTGARQALGPSQWDGSVAPAYLQNLDDLNTASMDVSHEIFCFIRSALGKFDLSDVFHEIIVLPGEWAWLVC